MSRKMSENTALIARSIRAVDELIAKGELGYDWYNTDNCLAGAYFRSIEKPLVIEVYQYISQMAVDAHRQGVEHDQEWVIPSDDWPGVKAELQRRFNLSDISQVSLLKKELVT